MSWYLLTIFSGVSGRTLSAKPVSALVSMRTLFAAAQSLLMWPAANRESPDMAIITGALAIGTLFLICSTRRWMCCPRIVRTRSAGARCVSSDSRIRSEPSR